MFQMLKMNRQIWPCIALTDVSAHHLGTVFAHGLQVVDLALQEGYLSFQVLLLWITHTYTHAPYKKLIEKVKRQVDK